jgi:formate dehydrogenase major subunit
VPGLGTSFGRGGATTAQQDLANADVILIMGSSMAENHPVGFRFVIKARERGATVIHIDPRFTRTSAMADVWVPLRAGSDIVFLGALVNYVLNESREFREYVVHYTNAPSILRDDFRDTEDLDGLFSGWNDEERKYSQETWQYSSERDDTLQHPRCVFQVLRRHYARYTPELVERACGVPSHLFLRVADAFTSASGPEKTGAICYAVGWTQHSVGVQIIRTAAILQLLLGNVGRPGGGVMALRGHASIQGSTDIPTLFDLLPGYLPMPSFDACAPTLSDYVGKHKAASGWWHNFDKYIVSLLKAWYGEAATRSNDWGFDWLPRITGDHSHFGYWLEMADGKIDGLFVMGQNPAVGAPNSGLERSALAKLKWLVVRDMVETETASFWHDSPEIESGESSPEQIGTEVFLLPAAGHAEKDGTFTNTQRLLQWHHKAVDPPGDARSELWFLHHLGRRLKKKAAGDLHPRHAALNALTWNYRANGRLSEPDAEEVLEEINGWTVADRRLVNDYRELKNDGTTACGCWIYSGVKPPCGDNKAKGRNASGPYGHGWGYAWPSDRRILYNRASARPDGAPWSERKKLVWWNADVKRWDGYDVPDFNLAKAPDYVPPPGSKGDDALAGDKPFILHSDGAGWIYAPSGLKDGPLPTHYEPLESPVENIVHRSRPTNPAADPKERPDNPYARHGDPRYPYVLTTYRMTEHHTAGGMTRFLPHLAELQPELFCEISPELAREVGVAHGAMVTVATPRARIVARAMVTSRIPPLVVDGRTVHQVGLPYHFGPRGIVTGDVVNDLLPISEEPNVRIFESKALLCSVSPVNGDHRVSD